MAGCEPAGELRSHDDLRAASGAGVPPAARMMLADVISGQALARRAASTGPKSHFPAVALSEGVPL
jgi:hypothetical protein